MNCERIRAQIAFHLYSELDEAARAIVEDHLESCAACAAEAGKERSLLAALSGRSSLEPSPNLLADSRLRLLRTLDEEPRGWLNPLEAMRQAWSSLQGWGRTAAATSLMAAGFFGGWWVRGASRVTPAGLPAGASIANISSVELDPAGGQVAIVFDEVQPRRLSGGVGDPGIQKFLLMAATEYDNPGVRLDTLEILKRQTSDRQIRNVLLHLVAQDRNDGVRLKALEGLQPYAQDAEVRQALVGVLTGDSNPGMRVQAIELLMKAQDRNLVSVLLGVAEKESNNYVRMRCRDALQAMNASVETF